MVPSTANSIDLSDSSSESSYSDSTLSSVSSIETDTDNSRYGSLIALGDRVCGVFHNQIAVLNNLVLVGFGVRPIYHTTTPIVLGGDSSSAASSTSSSSESTCNCSPYAQAEAEGKESRV